MKSFRLALSFLFVSVCALAEQADHWTYNPSAGTISDGEWTFAATVAADTSDMTVGGVFGVSFLRYIEFFQAG